MLFLAHQQGHAVTADGSAPPAPPAADEQKGAYLLIGTGCWLLPLVATLFLGGW